MPKSNRLMMIMPTINQFDGGASLFAGSTFLPSQITQAPDHSLFPAKSHGPQSLIPLTVKQINESYIDNGDKSSLIVYGIESNFRILGMAMDEEERATDVSFFIDDGTGRIEISKWPVIDFNDVSLHFIECVCVHLQNIRMKVLASEEGGVPNAVQMRPVISMPFSNGVKGYQAPVCNQFLAHSGMDGSGNDIYKIVLGIFL